MESGDKVEVTWFSMGAKGIAKLINGNLYFLTNDERFANYNSLSTSEKEGYKYNYHCQKVSLRPIDQNNVKNCIVEINNVQEYYKHYPYLLFKQDKVVDCTGLKLIYIQDKSWITSIKTPADMKKFGFPGVIPYENITLIDNTFYYYFHEGKYVLLKNPTLLPNNCVQRGSGYYTTTLEKKDYVKCKPSENKSDFLIKNKELDWHLIYLYVNGKHQKCMDVIKTTDLNHTIFISNYRLKYVGVTEQELFRWVELINNLGLSQIKFKEHTTEVNNTIFNNGEGYEYELLFKDQHPFVNYFITIILRYVLHTTFYPIYKEVIRMVDEGEDFFKAILLANKQNLTDHTWNISVNGKVDTTLTLDKYIERIKNKELKNDFTNLIK